MKLGPSTNHESGTVQVERTLRRNKDKQVLKRESHTEGVGPFSRDPVHARVGATVSATLSRNYHAVSVSVTVNIPAHATDEGVDEGLSWVFSRANKELNQQLAGANRALDKLADR
jgi:hypothetical protein